MLPTPAFCLWWRLDLIMHRPDLPLLRDEHRQAIDWLNEHTDEKLNFFLIKMELWKIGSSPPAPKFVVVSKPNDWTKTVREEEHEPTETKLMQPDFWNKFKQYAIEHNTSLRLRKPRPQHWYDAPVGSSIAYLTSTMNAQEGKVGCELYIPEEKRLITWLADHRSEIEIELGEKLERMELRDKKASRIRLFMSADFELESKWEEYFAWLGNQGEKFLAVFQKFIKQASID